MAKIAKTGDRQKVMDTTKSTDCPKCSKPTRIVKRVKDRERGIPGGVYISCSACEFYGKLEPAGSERFKTRQQRPAKCRAFAFGKLGNYSPSMRRWIRWALPVMGSQLMRAAHI